MSLPDTLPGRPRPHRVLHLERTGSTNAVARAGLAEGSLDVGDVVVADVQTAGRGRRGADWVAPPGRAFTASVVLDWPALPRPGALAVRAAVAAVRALSRCGVDDVAIKWPNDLLRGERKIGGMLIESVRHADGRPLQVLGLGLNLELRPGDLPDDLARLAGDAGLTRGSRDRDRLLAAWLDELDAARAGWGTPGDAGRADEYRARAWVRGRRVHLLHAGQPRQVRIRDVTGDGDLITEDDEHLPGELVERVRPA